MQVVDPYLPPRRVMIFIDGGYLRAGVRKVLKDSHADDRIDYSALRDYVERVIRSQDVKPEIMRAYYYDAQVESSDDRQEHEKQERYFKKVKSKKLYELRLGRLIKAGDNLRQKGVDILVAVDMLSKGYMKHYDVAAFIGGDDDFLDLISAVKNLAGRRVFGFFFQHNISKRLQDCFDIESKLTKDRIENFIKGKSGKKSS